MTEQEWHSTTSLWALLEAALGRVSGRRLLVAAVAGVRCCWDRINDDARRDLTRMEAYLEGEVGREVLSGRWPDELNDPGGCARWITDWVLQHHADTVPRQAVLYRCALGNPFRPGAAEPAWLAWEGGVIPRLAQGIHAERSWDRLPILADALEEAGCADGWMIEHCRADGTHLRGCWVVDRLLGRP